jgi:hypothetical protein
MRKDYRQKTVGLITVHLLIGDEMTIDKMIVYKMTLGKLTIQNKLKLND